jgi:hypothetical protein
LCSCKEEYLFSEEEKEFPGKFLAIRKKQILFFFRISKKTE